MIPIKHASFIPSYGGNNPSFYSAAITIEIPREFIKFFQSPTDEALLSDALYGRKQHTLEQAFLQLIPHLDAETLQEVLRIAATARLTK